MTSDEVEISACFVNAGCKIGYIRLCMRPLLQPAFPCLAAFLSVWQSVDFVNRLSPGKKKLSRAVRKGYSMENAPDSESITRPSGSVIRAGTPAGHLASMEKRPSFIVQRTETMPLGVGTSPAA